MKRLIAILWLVLPSIVLAGPVQTDEDKKLADYFEGLEQKVGHRGPNIELSRGKCLLNRQTGAPQEIVDYTFGVYHHAVFGADEYLTLKTEGGDKYSFSPRGRRGHREPGADTYDLWDESSELGGHNYIALLSFDLKSNRLIYLYGDSNEINPTKGFLFSGSGQFDCRGI